VPEIHDPQERAVKSKKASKRAIHEWNEYKMSLSNFAEGLVGDTPKGVKEVFMKGG
jgi:hypothetical protein